MELWAEMVARAFHESYERLAPDFGYKTREESAKPWADVPDTNKRLMVAVVRDLANQGVISSQGVYAALSGDRIAQTEPQPEEPGGF